MIIVSRMAASAWGTAALALYFFLYSDLSDTRLCGHVSYGTPPSLNALVKTVSSIPTGLNLSLCHVGTTSGSNRKAAAPFRIDRLFKVHIIMIRLLNDGSEFAQLGEG